MQDATYNVGALGDDTFAMTLANTQLIESQRAESLSIEGQQAETQTLPIESQQAESVPIESQQSESLQELLPLLPPPFEETDLLPAKPWSDESGDQAVSAPVFDVHDSGEENTQGQAEDVVEDLPCKRLKVWLGEE